MEKKKKEQSRFRLWVKEIYYLNRDERMLYHDSDLRLEEYWQMYKYWLKREYKHYIKENP